MRGLSKKMLISILTSVVVFVTMIATTFAWVGIFTYANTDKFSLNLKVSDLSANYFLTISSSGKKGTFSDEVPAIDIKRQIVDARFKGKYQNQNNSTIENIFNSITLAPTTTKILENNTFDSFYAVNYNKSELSFYESDDFYKFDLYFSVNTKEGIDENTTDIKSSVYLENIDEIITGTICKGIFGNTNPFKDLPSDSEYAILKNIPQIYSVNSKNAVRLGFSIFEPININDEYGEQLPFKSLIYQGGHQIPNYNESNNYYDLGGCLPYELNTAANELNIVRPYYRSKASIDLYNASLNEAISRNDLELSTDTSIIWNKRDHESYLGCMNGIQTKMKISIYFWFEGWDCDCLKLIEKNPVDLNLVFTSGTDD